MDVDEFAPRLAFFFVSRTSLLEEVAKFRAARRMWARIMREEFGAKNPKSLMLRFHTQTAGRAADRAAARGQPGAGRGAGTRGGAGRDAVAAHQLFRRGDRAADREGGASGAAHAAGSAYETDITKTIDPFAGSYVVESRTDELEAAADELMAKVADMGGAVAAIEQGFQKSEIERSAYRIANEIDSGERIVVGVNKFTVDAEEHYEPLRVNPAIEAEQSERLAALRATRDNAEVTAALDELKRAAEGTDNCLPR